MLVFLLCFIFVTILVLILIFCLPYSKSVFSVSKTSTNLIPKHVVVASNHSRYLQYWPSVKKAWQNIGINPIMIYVGTENHYSSDKNVKFFKQIENMSTVFQAQCIRLLYPALIDNSLEEGILTSDMDLIPLSKSFFFDNVSEFSKDDFVVYMKILTEYKMLPICYNLATSEKWSEIFEIKTENDIIETLKKWYKEYAGSWFTDQRILYNKVIDKAKFSKALGFDRLDKSQVCSQLISPKNKTDVHLPSYNDCPKIIDALVH
jgi:hypothetical protein